MQIEQQNSIKATQSDLYDDQAKTNKILFILHDFPDVNQEFLVNKLLSLSRLSPSSPSSPQEKKQRDTRDTRDRGTTCEFVKKTLRRQDLINKDFSIPYLEKLFRKSRSKCDELCYSYGQSTNGRPLYQFTSHSLRHTSINLVGTYLRDPYKICQFSRHSSSDELGVMAVYRYYSLDDMREDLTTVFRNYFCLCN